MAYPEPRSLSGHKGSKLNELIQLRQGASGGEIVSHSKHSSSPINFANFSMEWRTSPRPCTMAKLKSKLLILKES